MLTAVFPHSLIPHKVSPTSSHSPICVIIVIKLIDGSVWMCWNAEPQSRSPPKFSHLRCPRGYADYTAT